MKVWWTAARPKTLTAAAAPVLVGTACAAVLGGARPDVALQCLLGALLLQVAANFANDVFDYERGADGETRTGPLRVVQAGWISPVEMRRALAFVLLLCAGIGTSLAGIGGPVIAALGVASIVAAVAYTGGPYPLGYNGLGDVCVLAFFGFAAVVGTVFLQTGTAPGLAWAAAVPPGALATAILVVNNVRDEPEDRLVGKRTLPVRFGRAFGVAEYWGLLLAAYLVPLGIWVGGGSPVVLLPFLTLPWAARLARRVQVNRGGALNPVLAGTAKLLWWHSVAFALGLLANRLWPLEAQR